MCIAGYFLPVKRQLRMSKTALQEIGSRSEGRVLSGEVSLNQRLAEDEVQNFCRDVVVFRPSSRLPV